MQTNEDAVKKRGELVHETLQAYMDLFLMMQAVTLSHWLAFELTFAQGKAAILLAAHKELSVGELAKLLGVGKPTASVLVQQLVERGLVTRTEHARDRRRTVLRLSEKGAEIGAGRLKEREARWQGWLSHLSDEELDALARGLTALREVVQLESEGKALPQHSSTEIENALTSPDAPAARRKKFLATGQF